MKINNNECDEDSDEYDSHESHESDDGSDRSDKSDRSDDDTECDEASDGVYDIVYNLKIISRKISIVGSAFILYAGYRVITHLLSKY